MHYLPIRSPVISEVWNCTNTGILPASLSSYFNVVAFTLHLKIWCEFPRSLRCKRVKWCKSGFLIEQSRAQRPAPLPRAEAIQHLCVCGRRAQFCWGWRWRERDDLKLPQLTDDRGKCTSLKTSRRFFPPWKWTQSQRPWWQRSWSPSPLKHMLTSEGPHFSGFPYPQVVGWAHGAQAPWGPAGPQPASWEHRWWLVCGPSRTVSRFPSAVSHQEYPMPGRVTSNRPRIMNFF